MNIWITRLLMSPFYVECAFPFKCLSLFWLFLCVGEMSLDAL